MRHNNSKLQQLNASCRVFYLLFQVKHIEKVDINARKNKIFSAKNSLFLSLLSSKWWRIYASVPGCQNLFNQVLDTTLLDFFLLSYYIFQ